MVNLSSWSVGQQSQVDTRRFPNGRVPRYISWAFPVDPCFAIQSKKTVVHPVEIIWCPWDIPQPLVNV